ncbi:hypothetical protein WAI453_005778 [Rhynchosporium graminicola]
MGSFVFKWDHPADEVYVTGTFDNWEKSEKLVKNGNSFSKDVKLNSAADKIYYKVCGKHFVQLKVAGQKGFIYQPHLSCSEIVFKIGPLSAVGSDEENQRFPRQSLAAF